MHIEASTHLWMCTPGVCPGKRRSHQWQGSAHLFPWMCWRGVGGHHMPVRISEREQGGPSWRYEGPRDTMILPSPSPYLHFASTHKWHFPWHIITKVNLRPWCQNLWPGKQGDSNQHVFLDNYIELMVCCDPPSPMKEECRWGDASIVCKWFEWLLTWGGSIRRIRTVLSTRQRSYLQRLGDIDAPWEPNPYNYN